MKSASEYRRDARESLEGKLFGNTWLMMVLVILLVGALSALSGYTLFGVFLIQGPLYAGMACYTLHLVRRDAVKNDLNLLLLPLKKDLNGTVLLGFLQLLFTFLWTLLLIVPGIIKGLSYSMCYHVKEDHPEWTAQECLKESQRIMKGHKWKLFCLKISFIGWIIVGVLCLGIGVIWASAYMQVAQTHFYEDLPKEIPTQTFDFKVEV